MTSNLTNQSRNVFSKKLLADKEVTFPPSKALIIDPNCRFATVHQCIFCEHCTPSHNSFSLQDNLDDVNLFSIMTVMAFLLSAPLMLSVEGIKFSPSYLQSTVSLANFENMFLVFCRFSTSNMNLINTSIF
jgi:solute carrier family 35 protein E1